MKNRVFLLRAAFGNKKLLVGSIILLTLLFVLVFAEFIAPYGYRDIDMKQRNKAPSAAHLFGTDSIGRDVFSRVVFGTRIALRTAVLIVGIQTAVGMVLGISAGYFGGLVDKGINVLTSVVLAIPGIVLAMAIITFLGPSLENVIISLAAVRWPRVSRVLRAKTMSLKNMAFVDAGRSIKESHLAIIWHYLLPNLLPTTMVLVVLSIPLALLTSSSLSFLGLGSQPPSPDWGAILADGRQYLLSAPWIAIFPGLALGYTTFGLSILGEGVREVLDPKLEGGR